MIAVALAIRYRAPWWTRPAVTLGDGDKPKVSEKRRRLFAVIT